MERKEEERVVIKKAEIDTRPPFRSVKEAVKLFGERILTRDVYDNKLDEMRIATTDDGNGSSRMGIITVELEETKESLKKARDDGLLMANSLTALKEELDQTKRELLQLKAKESLKQPIELDIEDIKFVENATNFEAQIHMIDEVTEFQQKRSVKFANPPSLEQVLTVEDCQVLERHHSMKKKMLLIPFIGGIFSKKKRFREGVSLEAQDI